MTQTAPALARAPDCTLVVLDVQTRATAAVPPADADSVCHAIAMTLRAAQALALPVIYTEHTDPPLGAIDARIASALPESAFAVRKTTYCAWADDPFANAVEIAARRQIVICGLQTHVGVLQTAVAMAACDYRVFVPEDAVCSHDAALTRNALHRLRADRVAVTNCESLLYEWLAESEHAVRQQVLSILQES